jgi:DNA-directed RNA polymerase subunit H (RpoH/RPB5)
MATRIKIIANAMKMMQRRGHHNPTERAGIGPGWYACTWRDKHGVTNLHVAPNDCKMGIPQVRLARNGADVADANMSLVFVGRDKCSASARRALSAHGDQYFVFADVLFDITSHPDVPKHTQLSETAADELCSTLRVRRKQLPVLLLSDPVCRYYKFNVDAVVQIKRHMPPLQPHMYYRRVAAEP